MEKDIAPELIENVNKAFEKNCMKDGTMQAMTRKLEDGAASYADAYQYATSVGNARAKAFKSEISSSVLPDGHMYFNIADRLINDSLGTDHDMVADYAAKVQALYNDEAGISLKAQKADKDEDRIKGFIDRLDSEEDYDKVAWILDEPVRVHAMSVVDDTIKKNAEFQGKAGIKATVIRDAKSDCCGWCTDLAGDYVYPKVPNEVFARHDNCRCTLEYDGRKLTAYNSGGKAHSFRDQAYLEKIDTRKEHAEKIDKEASSKLEKKRIEAGAGAMYNNITKTYTPAKTINEAEEFIKQYVDETQFAALGVKLKGIGLDAANEINKTIASFCDTYDVDKFGGVYAPARNTKLGKLIMEERQAHAGYDKVRNSFIINRESFKSAKHLEKMLADEKKGVTDYLNNSGFDVSRLADRAVKILENSRTSGRATVPETVEDVINHELGHSLEKKIYASDNYIIIASNMATYAPRISGYACDNMGDYIAESFCSYRKGESVIDPELIKAFKALEKVV